MTNKPFVLIREGKTHGYYSTEDEAIGHGHTLSMKSSAAVQVAQLIGEVTYKAETKYVQSHVEPKPAQPIEETTLCVTVMTTHRGHGLYRIVNDRRFDWRLVYKDELYAVGTATTRDEALSQLRNAYSMAESGKEYSHE